MVHLDEIMRQLAANAQAIRALVENVPDEQAVWKPDPQAWSLAEVMDHMHNEERVDFRRHLKEMFVAPAVGWSPNTEDMFVHAASLRESLAAFVAEREASLLWLRGLNDPNWDVSVETPWGAIRTGDVLASWPAHDYLHIRQLNEILFAMNKQQNPPYEVRYAGDW